MMKRGIFVLEYVKEEHLNPNLTEAVEQFKKQYPVLNKFEDRIPSPSQFYYGKERGKETPSFLVKNEPGCSIFGFYKKIFDDIWEESESMEERFLDG